MPRSRKRRASDEDLREDASCVKAKKRDVAGRRLHALDATAPLAIKFPCVTPQLLLRPFEESFVTRRPWNHQADLVIINPNLNLSVQPETYYHVGTFRLSNLIDKTFIDTCVAQGKITLLSVGRWIDKHDWVVSIDTKGCLTLNVSKNLYQRLGIVGKRTQFKSPYSAPQRYVIKIDLLAEAFRPTSKYWNNTYQSLLACLDEPFVGMYHFDKREGLMMADFAEAKTSQAPPNLLGLSSCTLKADRSLRYFNEVSSPPRCPKALYEWLGLLVAGGPGPPTDGSQGICRPTVSASVHRWQGFLGPLHIRKILEALQGDQEWYLMVHGFRDATSVFSGREHCVKTGDGENLYTITHEGTLILQGSAHDNVG